MSTFLGQFLHAIDDKGRVPLPAKFRNGDGSTGFVAVRGVGSCLYLYPEKAWRGVLERLALLRRGTAESRRQMVAVTAQAAELVLDKQGRLSLPQHLVEIAGLEHEALFVGAADTIQIWNPARFAEVVQLDAIDYDRVAAAVL
ncbi:MAG: division/cell wall cluster transcriptional repressor MraZ [Gemmatimonadota bacterium]